MNEKMSENSFSGKDKEIFCFSSVKNKKQEEKEIGTLPSFVC